MVARAAGVASSREIRFHTLLPGSHGVFLGSSGTPNAAGIEGTRFPGAALLSGQLRRSRHDADARDQLGSSPHRREAPSFNGHRALCARVPRLLHELAIARADGTYVSMLQRLAQVHVLVLDDFLIAPLKDQERRDLLEVLEDRYGIARLLAKHGLAARPPPHEKPSPPGQRKLRFDA
ncbi:MAG: ATP-binding protein [Polyangiaceae bacterium]